MSEISIRNAEPEDCARIAQLMSELHRDEGYEVIASEAEITRALFEETRAVKLRALVALDSRLSGSDSIIGTLFYYAGYDTLSAVEGYHVADIIVTATHRRAGIGKSLMHALAQRACTDHKQWLSLTVLRHNEAARRFYQSLGMTQVEVDFFAIGKTTMSQL